MKSELKLTEVCVTLDLRVAACVKSAPRNVFFSLITLTSQFEQSTLIEHDPPPPPPLLTASPTLLFGL